MKSNAEYVHNILTRALRLAPKSGEVWCEGCRYYLNPRNDRFSLSKASTIVSHEHCDTHHNLVIPLLSGFVLRFLKIESDGIQTLEYKINHGIFGHVSRGV